MNATLDVLIVEDDARYRSMLMSMLRELSCNPSAAASATEALAWLDGHRADVIILDLNMPRVDGLEFLSTLRRRDRATAVMILTGVGSLEAAQIAIRHGVSEFLTKPCHMGVLEAALNRLRRALAESSPQGMSVDTRFGGDRAGESTAGQTLAVIEQQAILTALRDHHGNRSAAADALGISRRTLHYRLAAYRQKGLPIDGEAP